MQRLSYIDLNHFRSFRKPSRINFPEKGLMRIRGRNLDTGGESAAGKSTIALAINFVLGRCPYPATALQSWGTANVASATLGFRDDTYVERGKKFSIMEAGSAEPVKGSAAQKEEWLSKFFGGLDMDMVMALTYRGQKKPGLFLSKTDSEKKEFLTRLLGLDKFEKAIEDGKSRVSALEVKVASFVSVHDSVMKSISELGPVSDTELLRQEESTYKNSIDFKISRIAGLKVDQANVRAYGEAAAKAARESFAPKIREAQEKVRELQKAPIDVGEADTTELKKYQDIAKQCQERITRLVSEDLTKRTEFEQKRDALVARISGLDKLSATSSGLLRDRVRLSMEYESLKQDVCPTCKREWDQAVERRGQIETEVVGINEKLDECAACQQSAIELRAELDSLPRFETNPLIVRLQKSQSDARARAATEQQKIDGAAAEASAERRRLLAEARADEAVLTSNASAAAGEVAGISNEALQALEKEISTEQTALADARAMLSALQQEMVRATTMRTQYDRLAEQAEKALKERTDAEEALKAEKDFLGMIGREGFLGSIFDEVLAEISDETNQLLASVANTRQCTLRFASESTTQKGTIKKEIKPVVTIHGYEAPMESGLSGGMFSVVELAVDLALGAVISRRSGVCPGWLILDESFDGLGAVEKESAMEILQRYAQDRLVIVIDHTTEFQGMFTQSVTIEYKGGDSWVAP